MDLDLLACYLPQDRRAALAAGQDLPDRTDGAALFADVSGSTPLTEALARALGPQRGAEELQRLLGPLLQVQEGPAAAGQSTAGHPAPVVVSGLAAPVAPAPWPPLPPGALAAEQVRPWFLPLLYARLTHAPNLFLAELRPTVALFL